MALSFLTYFFLRSTRARYDGPSSTLPLEVATVMDISVGQEEEALQREQEAETKRQHVQLRPTHETNRNNNQVIFSIPAKVEAHQNDKNEQYPGAIIGQVDPFEQAYLQPALRANPHARPEQPFPPSQLGREDVFLGQNTFGSAFGVIGEEETIDTSATVRLKCFNHQDRVMIDQWWQEQLEQCGEQNILGILSGEECGTLCIGKPMQMQNDRLV